MAGHVLVGITMENATANITTRAEIVVKFQRKQHLGRVANLVTPIEPLLGSILWSLNLYATLSTVI